MNQYIIIFSLLFFTVAPAQDFAKDTIQLHEVLIDKQLKKPKIKTIKVGNGNLSVLKNDLYFTKDPVFYLTDSLPFGHIQKATILFSIAAIKYNFDKNKKIKVKKTEFDITIYEVGDNYSVGDTVNEEPIRVTLEESGPFDIKKVDLELSKYNLKAKMFYITIKYNTPIDCEDCYYHAPILYSTGDNYHYVTKGKKDIYKKQDKSFYSYCLGLKINVRTLTQDY